VPPDDQATRSAARCATHTGIASVAVCHSCGRPLCLRCAVPVRGEVFGRECLAEVLGPQPSAPPQAVPARRPDATGLATGAGMLVALIGSVLPWTHFGMGAGTFGAWGFSPFRWSGLSAAAATLGSIVWIALRASRRARWGVGLATLGALSAAAMAGAVLHMFNPPPFTHAWLGPWVALGGSTIALCAAAAALTTKRTTTPDIP
jgi:hypothetical protein